VKKPSKINGVISGGRFGSAAWDRGLWLALLFVVLGVAAPTACVLWFMNEASKAQAEAARQGIASAYRNQLVFLRDRLDEYWDRRANDLSRLPRGNSASDFARAVKANAADSLVFRGTGSSYPSYTVASSPATLPNDNDPSAAARRAQTEIRQILHGPRSGSKDRVVQLIDLYFTSGPAVKGTDTQGRLIAADEQLLAAQLLQHRDPRRLVFIDRLSRMLNDYENTRMPAAQRLFLMDEVRALAPKTGFPTYNAERLAAGFLETDDPRFSGAGLQATHVPDLWKLTSSSGRVIALYTTNTVTAAMQKAIDENTTAKGVRMSVVLPGVHHDGETIAAGTMLPGWQLALDAVDTRFMNDAARARNASYLWIGYVVIGAMVLTGLAAIQFLRGQVRLARLKTDLVSAVSHELRTPLASMRLLVDSLLEADAFDPVRTQDYLQLISTENLRLTRMVENFLTFSRIERKRYAFELRETAPQDIVDAAAAVVLERYPASDFAASVESGLPPIEADSDAFFSALLNLLDNAYKYSGPHKRIRLHAYSEPDQIVFEVEDNGIGIAPREQKKIFRRFYRVDRSLTRETSGCGLGLSIVESVIRAHGGSVRLRSHPGVGSTFALCIPLKRAPVAESTRPRTITA
jgi:signal transduction histidine kinase